MSAAMRHVAHLAIRNRGTIGGSLSHADPAAELPMIATFYEAGISVQGPSGRRKIDPGDFFVDALTNCLEPEEIVVEVEFPILKQDGWAFEEVARRFGDFALASIAVSVRRGTIGLEAARVAVMGVADTPQRLREAEDQLVAMELNDRTPDRFSEIVVSLVSPNDDLHASADYRKHLLAQLAKRALWTALAMRG
jgi:carbon-monoxide dehydrogenase medium subunit